ncbi:hypothetical protein [Frederiksenia canicola]|uniref:Uncharacterized protein n=1 Tax=Frederiksenia canicola TaxID=123824 RepID=A0AAE7C3B3_9PAST|nr:hypothetical protein [Frederiksenia canicola]QIM65493.1 hypothetical protein A4G17_08585 [Frederiksenia canicola]RPE96061.1 hypothetical protein EDC49_0442 [Frederiksenia canicola]
MDNKRLFDLYYSYNLTKIYETFNLRIANFILLMQFILGSSIVVDVVRFLPPHIRPIWHLISGLLIVFLSALSFIYKYSENAILAAQLKKRYGHTINQYQLNKKLNIDREMLKIEPDDIKIVGAFEDIAYKRSLIQLGLPDKKKLTRYQKLVAFLCSESF